VVSGARSGDGRHEGVTSQAATAPRLGGVSARIRGAVRALSTTRPLYVLGTLVAAQWVALLALALTVRHNGWLYYAGGDQLWHYSGAYVLAHGHLPPAFVGYGWSVLLAPVAAIAGPNIVSALPAIVLFNTLILLPVALLCVYGIAERIAGRLFGYWAAALWVAVPYLGVLLVEPGYHQKYTELTLPQLLGLSSAPDFPSMVALLISAYFCLRTFDSAGWQAPVAAGLAAGYSIALKPSNALFLFAPAVLFLVRRWRAVLPFALGLAPALLTLALWKYRGLGELAAAPEPERLAGVGDLSHRIYDPGLNSWEHLHQVLLGLREHFWAARVLEWLPLAGIVALALRSVRGLLLLGTWFVAYLLVKGTYVPASVEDASFFRILMPAFPAYLLLAASTVLLVPRMRAQPGPSPVRLRGRRLTVALVTATAVFAIVPAAVIAATPTLQDGGSKAVAYPNSLLPVTGRATPTATAKDGAIRVSWDRWRSASARVFYRLLRTSGPNEGVACGGVRRGANQCNLYMDTIASIKATSFVDQPGPGTWTYRVGVAANWLDDPNLGDVTLLSRPVTVSVR
jgi:hypothetical protein